MNRLDHFFRSRYPQFPPPAETPPAGAWEQLEGRLAAAQATEEGRRPLPILFRWSSGGAALVFLLAGIAWAVSDPVLPEQFAFPIPQVPSRSAAYHVVSAPDAVAPPAPVAADHRSEPPGARPVTGYAVPAGEREPAAESPGALGSGFARPTVTVPRPAVRPVAELVPGVARSVSSLRSDADYLLRRMVAGLDPIMVPVQPADPSRARRYAGDALAAKGPKNRFERVPHYARNPPNWEVSARVLPLMIGGYGSFERLTSVPPASGQAARFFTVPDGPPLQLYNSSRAGSYGSIYDRQLGIYMAGIEVARRFSSGFRFSLGGVYSHEGGGADDPGRDVVNNLAADEYLLVTAYDLNWASLWLTLGVQYTINRRRRFRINIGLQGLGMVADTYGREQFLLGGEPRESIFVSRVTTRNRTFLSWVLPAPQLTFEYRLRQHIALSLGIGGMTGIGATYQWGGPGTRVQRGHLSQ